MARRLTSGFGDRHQKKPCFSADGRTIYFVGDRGGGPRVYRVAAGGG